MTRAVLGQVRCGNDARRKPRKSPTPDFSTVPLALGNPAKDAGFPHSHSDDNGWITFTPELNPQSLKKPNPSKIKGPVGFSCRAEFGEWFCVKLDGPFLPGQVSRGQIAYPGYEHVKWEAVVQKMEHEPALSFTWPHPKSFRKEENPVNYLEEPSTFVEFRLEKTAGGTLLVLTESGFDALPGDRRLEAFRRNDGGWTEQVKNIENYVTQKP